MRVDKEGYRMGIEKKLGLPFETLISLERMLLCDLRKLHFIILDLPETELAKRKRQIWYGSEREGTK